MTLAEYMAEEEPNIRIIDMLSKAARAITSDGEVISDTRIKDNEVLLVIKRHNFFYKLYMVGDTCKSITWERGS